MRSPKKILNELLGLLVLAALAVAAIAAEPAERLGAPQFPQTPRAIPATEAVPVGAVKAGIFLFSVQELDFARRTFRPTFEIWFRWRGEGFDPIANVHVVGAKSMTIIPEDRRKLPNGENYAVAQVDAVINENFDTSAFPFDRHRLHIVVESPYEDDYLVYDADTDGSMLDPEAFSPGWRLTGFKLGEQRKRYPTHFGLPERAEERYSELAVEVVAERVGWRIAVDYFIGFIVCALLCLCGYFIPPTELGVRASLVTAATFTAVGNKYIVNSLTETSVTATLANLAVFSAFAMVLLLMVTSILCQRLIAAGNGTRATRLNRNVGIASATGYALVMAFFLWRALTSGPA